MSQSNTTGQDSSILTPSDVVPKNENNLKIEQQIYNASYSFGKFIGYNSQQSYLKLSREEQKLHQNFANDNNNINMIGKSFVDAIQELMINGNFSRKNIEDCIINIIEKYVPFKVYISNTMNPLEIPTLENIIDIHMALCENITQNLRAKIEKSKTSKNNNYKNIISELCNVNVHNKTLLDGKIIIKLDESLNAPYMYYHIIYDDVDHNDVIYKNNLIKNMFQWIIYDDDELNLKCSTHISRNELVNDITFVIYQSDNLVQNECGYIGVAKYKKILSDWVSKEFTQFNELKSINAPYFRLRIINLICSL